MIVEYDENGAATNLYRTHSESSCRGRLCDVHGRFGEEPWASWKRNFREDRGMMEMIDPRTGIGHPTPAQVAFWHELADRGVISRAMVGYEAAHGCDGGCARSYHQVDRLREAVDA